MHGLRDIRVIDFSTEIAGPYCTKLFADAGADVIKVESRDGDPLRRWSATGADCAAATAFSSGSSTLEALGDRLPGGRSDRGTDRRRRSGRGELRAGPHRGRDLRARFPALTLLSISPFGRGGPWTHRPSTEFTLQAESGSIGVRGRADREPFQAGGRITEWLGGAFAAVGALAAVQRARRTGHGEHVDVSLLEAISLGGSTFLDLFHSLFGRPPADGAGAHAWRRRRSSRPPTDRSASTPTPASSSATSCSSSSGPTCSATRSWRWRSGAAGASTNGMRSVHAYTTRHTTAELVERAAALRIPVAPVHDGDSVRRHEHLVARGIFVPDPRGVRASAPAVRIDGRRPRAGATGAAPRRARRPHRAAPPRRAAGERSDRRLPLAGLRILDMTNWWAGPVGDARAGDPRRRRHPPRVDPEARRRRASPAASSAAASAGGSTARSVSPPTPTSAASRSTWPTRRPRPG